MSIKSYKLKNDETRYLFRVYLGMDPATGKRVRIVRKGFLTYNEAKDAKTKIMLEYSNEGRVKRDTPVRFRDLYETWLQGYQHTVKESTLRKTSEAFRLHILPVMGNYIVQETTLTEAQAAVNIWHKKLKNFRMVKGYAAAVYTEAIRQGMIDRNPFDLVIYPKQKKPPTEERLNFYDKEELQAFLEAVERDEGMKWYAFFRVLAFTGIRKGEALALTWKDIDFRKRRLSIDKTLSLGMDNQFIIQEPKTNKRRSISLDDKTVKVLEEWKKEQLWQIEGFGLEVNKKQLVFANESNTYLALPQPGHILNRVCKNNKLRRITVHGFRHSHCSLLFEAGLTLKEVQDRLGHSDIKTTMNIYAHVTQGNRDGVADKFARFVSF